jgi:hypothetical protein
LDHFQGIELATELCGERIKRHGGWGRARWRS